MVGVLGKEEANSRKMFQGRSVSVLSRPAHTAEGEAAKAMHFSGSGEPSVSLVVSLVVDSEVLP